MGPTISGSDNSEGLRRHLLASLFDTVDHGLVLLDAQGIILQANRWMEEAFPAGHPLAGKGLEAVLRDGAEPAAEAGCLDFPSAASCQVEVLRSLPEGGEQWLEVCFHRIEDSAHNRVGAVGHIVDISDRRKTEQAMADEISRWRTMVEQSRDGIVVLDQDGMVYEANQEFARMLGYSMDEVYHLGVWDWEALYPKDLVKGMINSVDSKGDHFETCHRRKDGSTYDVEISTNGATFGGQKLIFCVCRDVTEKKAMQERIRAMAIRDPLTEIYNRRYAFERLAQMAAEYARCGTQFCVSVLDLDHFKKINDTHGHMAGDSVLKDFARMVGSVTRPYDLLGRYGGEEFIIVSRNASWTETTAMIERVMGLVRHEGFMFDGQAVQLSFSCGLADSSEFPRDGLSVESMVKLADQRLYQAKAAGRDLCVGPCGSRSRGPRDGRSRPLRCSTGSPG